MRKRERKRVKMNKMLTERGTMGFLSAAASSKRPSKENKGKGEKRNEREREKEEDVTKH